MEADWPLTARFDEHRLSDNTRGLVCALGEQERSTDSISVLLVCRLPRAQGLTRLIHPILVWALGEHKRPTGQIHSGLVATVTDSHPPRPRATLSSRPTHRLLRNRSPGDVRFAQAHPPRPRATLSSHPTHRLLRNRLPATRPLPKWRWRDALA